MHHCRRICERMHDRTDADIPLRTASGKRLSTLQVVAREIRPGTFQYMEWQNRAAYNGPPPDEAVMAAAQLLRALNQGELRHHRAAPRGGWLP